MHQKGWEERELSGILEEEFSGTLRVPSSWDCQYRMAPVSGFYRISRWRTQVSWLSEAGQKISHCMAMKITWKNAKMCSLIDYYILFNTVLCLPNVDNITASSHNREETVLLDESKTHC